MLIFQSCAHLPVHSCLEMLRLRLDQNCTYSARATGRTSKKVVWFCTCNHSRCTSNPTPARAICDVAQATLLVQNSVARARATIHVAPATPLDCTCRTPLHQQLLGLHVQNCCTSKDCTCRTLLHQQPCSCRDNCLCIDDLNGN